LQYIFTANKKMMKSVAALTLITEIRHAENLLDEIKNHGINLTAAANLITSNSWEKYGYLFSKDLDYDLFNAIGKFYNNYIVV
jgi:hypothetical protein